MLIHVTEYILTLLSKNSLHLFSENIIVVRETQSFLEGYTRTFYEGNNKWHDALTFFLVLSA